MGFAFNLIDITRCAIRVKQRYVAFCYKCFAYLLLQIFSCLFDDVLERDTQIILTDIKELESIKN